MTFVEAVLRAFDLYKTFDGRARRSEYWWFTLFASMIFAFAYFFDTGMNTPVLVVFAFLGLVLPMSAVTVRRLHDTGRSGAWVLVTLVPLVGAVVLLIFTCQRSDSGSNPYGAAPE